MAQKANKPDPAPIIITITLPEEDKLQRTGQILIQRGSVATLRQFEYGDLGDIMTAIQDSATWLTEVEANPPDLTPAPVRPQAAVTPPQPEGSAAQEQTFVGPNSPEQATGDAQPSPDAGIPADQLQLF